jgi:hypothetical protein
MSEQQYDDKLTSFSLPIITTDFLLAQQPPVDQGLFIREVYRSHTMTGLLLVSLLDITPW